MIIAGIIISLLTALYELFNQQRGIVWISYGIINPLLLLAPRIIFYNSRDIRNRITIGIVRRIELFGTFIIALNAPGSLFFHEMGIQYDRPLHFLMGMTAVFVAVLIMSIFYEKPSYKKNHILTWSIIAIFSGLFLFELFQFFIDNIFKTHLFSDAAQNIKTDFWEDILFGTAGLIWGIFHMKIISSEYHDTLRTKE